MSVTYVDILDCAEHLVKGGKESHFRSAISRAYYSAFHAARETADLYFPDQHPGTSGRGSHERVIDRLTGSANMTAKGAGYMLIGLKTSRKRADYELADSMDEDDAELAIANARVIQTKLSQCAPSCQVPASGTSGTP